MVKLHCTSLVWLHVDGQLQVQNAEHFQPVDSSGMGVVLGMDM